MATPLTRAEWLDECAKLAKTYEDAMTDEAKALVARFRTIAEWLDPEIDMIDEPDVLEAADLIETQAREIERLREALEVIRDGDYPYKQASQYAHEALRMKQCLTLKS